MSAPPKTKPGMRRLSDLARKVVAPRDITSTAWPAVRNLCEQKLGLTFDDWQHGAGRVILSKREDGKLAAMIDGEATVKTLQRRDGHVWLMPHNPDFAPIAGDDATILGRVVTVLRGL